MAVSSLTSETRPMQQLPYRLSIEASGLAIVLLGAWVGVITYVAPALGFRADAAAAWSWNAQRALLFLAPGAVAFVVAACGAWLIAGPISWRVAWGHPFFSTGASPVNALAYWAAYSGAPGALLLAFGSFILGRARPNWQPRREAVQVG